MDNTQSDADKIRAKRLAKLGGQNTSTTSPQPAQNGSEQSEQQSTTATSQQAPDTMVVDKPDTAAIPAENPFSKLAAQPEVESKKSTASQVTIKPRPSSPAKRERDGSERPRSRVAERPPESLQTWLDRHIRQVFRVTLKPEELKDGHGNKLVHIPRTKEELVDSNKPLLLGEEELESVITEAAGQISAGKRFEYLLQCFKRASRAIRADHFKGADDLKPKQQVLKEAKRLSMNYSIFAVTMPEMFGDEVPASNRLVDHLLAEPECDVGICTDFLTEASNRFDEEDGEEIKQAIIGAAEELSRQLAEKDMLADYQNYVRGLRNLLRFPKIVEAVTQSENWAPKGTEAQDIEKKTIMGPFFRLSPMQQSVASSYFSAPRTRDRGFIGNAQNAVRMTLRTHQSELFEICNGIVRSGPTSRERMLDWFAMCVNLNHKKRAMRVNFKVVSTDGFMVNVTNVLDQLCDPFMDAQFGKIEKIDVDYLRRNPRVDISDETKINVDQKASDEFYSHKAEGTSNFISEVFFLTVAAHHYGTEAAQTRMTQMRKSVKRMEQDLVTFEGERHKYVNDPRYLARYEEHHNRIKRAIDDDWSTIHATTGVLLDDLNQARSMQFMRYVIVWMLRLASGQNVPKETLKLPLPTEQAAVFKSLPEYFLEDIVDNFKFITSNMPNIITPQQSEEILQVCVTFLRSSEYVKNPGVKSGLVSILFYGVMPYGNQSRGVLGDLLIGSSFAHQHLLHALMKFYIEAESTGTHTQFFDKFNIRYEIFQVIKKIWVNTLYRENLAKEARVNTDFFVQFVNMLVNDATFVLDESLSAFIKINQLTLEMADHNVMRELNEEQRKEKQELLDDQKGKAKSYMQLTRESMETLILFTETLAEAFTMKEIVIRLAHMLDYNLDLMTSKKQRDLKVDQPEQYGFHPLDLLADIMTVYTNLAAKQNFIDAIADDGRSYKPENFHKAVDVMSRHARKSPEEVRVWNELTKHVAEAKAALDQEEEDLGEAPDEFLDPLLSDLMSDPVILPLSKNTVDRSTIRSHLLSDPTDPFNRTPLKIEDVIPNTELKQQIEEWKAAKKAEKKAQREAEKMDTSQ